MEETITSAADICLTILGIGIGWGIVVWLDRNVFNKNRYYNKRKKK